MRGLLVIGILIALAIVGILSLKETRDHLGPMTNDAQSKAEAVRQEVERITEERMQQLRERDH